jgi:hypothetical protein
MISHRQWFEIVVTPSELLVALPGMFESINDSLLAIVCWTLKKPI